MEKVYNLVEFDKVAEFLSECAISELGRLRCLNLIVFDDAKTIKKELLLTTQAKNVLNQALNLPIETIKDIQKSLDDAKKQLRLSETEIYDIADVIRTSRLVKLFLGRLSLDFFELSELKNPLFSNKELEDKIFNIFDNTLRIKNDASVELKRLNLALRDNLSNVKKTISKLLSDTTFSSYLQDNLYTEREGRTVFQVKAECKNKVAGIVHDISATSQTYFIEPRELVGLNNKIREIEILIGAEIEKILKALSVEISKFYYEISGSFKQLIEIDFVFAKAKYSIKTDSCAAEISDYKKISLKAMKNPVLMSVKENIIEKELYLEKENNCLIITGSNTGGKTVILKTLGLFILMAKAGLHIPCYEAHIYPFKKIFADIGDEQSIIQSLSTFSSHMTNIVKILEQSDGETIVLLDEISAGTDPSEGASLAQAILEYLQEKGTFCIATTHYGELKSLAYLHKGFVNASVEFDLNTLSPTYKLLTGIPGSSNAIAIAGNLGINDKIVQKARDIYFNKKGTDAKVLEELQLAQQQLSESAKSAQNAEYEVKQLEEELKQKLNELKKEKKKNINIYKKKYESLIESAKDEVKEILKEIREEKSEKLQGEALQDFQKKKIS
jgi:DNA mismatch repair protein MutS2